MRRCLVGIHRNALPPEIAGPQMTFTLDCGVGYAQEEQLTTSLVRGVDEVYITNGIQFVIPMHGTWNNALSAEINTNLNGLIYPFGGHKLGVHDKNLVCSTMHALWLKA